MPVIPVLTILPLSATVIAGAFAIVLLNRYLATRRRPHELMWGIAFLLFALGAGCQVFADIGNGWTPTLARIYYLSGAILNVGFLGVGTLYLLFTRRIANIGFAAMVFLSVVSIYVLFTVPVDASRLGEEAGWRAVATLSPAPRWLAAISNTLGTILVAGGAIWSGVVFWRKRIMKGRMIGVFLLALGTLVVALGGTVTGLTGLRNHDYLYISMAVGAVIMFSGYLQTIRPDPSVVHSAKLTAENAKLVQPTQQTVPPSR
ncbi:MAG TPA: hypothetical protein VJ183_12135 [Chloroflexia bacterium]|nr:hypothetical protein [Chloroflexia bacterium]